MKWQNLNDLFWANFTKSWNFHQNTSIFGFVKILVTFPLRANIGLWPSVNLLSNQTCVVTNCVCCLFSKWFLDETGYGYCNIRLLGKRNFWLWTFNVYHLADLKVINFQNFLSGLVFTKGLISQVLGLKPILLCRTFKPKNFCEYGSWQPLSHYTTRPSATSAVLRAVFPAK